MKILLLNDNPVVNKLVTLSAQKTSDELEVVENTDVINAGAYDLVVVDDSLYRDTLFGVLKEKITFSKSLYICSRDAQSADEFSKIIKKPFLPTDLVELFSLIGKEVKEEIENGLSEDEETDLIEDIGLDSFEETLEEDEFNLEEINLDDTQEMSLDDDLFSTTDVNEDTLELDTLDDGLNDDILELDDFDEKETNNVLDKDELEEVQELLDMTDEEESVDESSFEDLDGENEIKLDDLDSMLENIEETTSLAEEPDDIDMKSEINLEEALDLDNLDMELDDTEIELEENTSFVDEGEDSLEDEINLDSVVEETTSDDEIQLDELDSILDEAEETIASRDEISSLTEEEITMDDLDSNMDESLELGEELEDEIVLESDDGIEEELEDEETFNELEALEMDTPIEENNELYNEEDLLEETVLEEDLDTPANLELKIENAVSALTQEELNTELDEESLEDITTSEFDSLDSLNSRDLKLAFGEEVPELEEVVKESIVEIEEAPQVSDLEITPDNQGVESLKKLLAVLNDKEVAASMKGMKISINIELGEN